MTTLTEQKLQAHLAGVRPFSFADGTFRGNIPHIVCADGTRLSMQASLSHYCTPRDDKGPWREVEVGFPSRELTGLMAWAEEPDEPTETVYGYVPLSVLADIVDSCGGLMEPAP